MIQCKKCGSSLTGQRTVYCSKKCGRRYLKALWQKRRSDVVNAASRRRRKQNALRREPYIILCQACPEGRYLSRGYRKHCPLHFSAAPMKLRFLILKRDGFRCRYCGRSAPDVALQVDHIIPRKVYGPSEIANLTTSCRDCNIGKGAN